MSQNPPPRLYRYRPLDDGLFERELGALEKAFLWSPHFSEMNDPMEAFYELGGPADPIIDRLVLGSGKSTGEMYRMAQKVIANFCLVSLASSHLELPMWAYYASNFAGMCLEFATDELFVGDFQNERLVPVTYSRTPLPPIQFHELADMQPLIEARFSRKRIEWQHEKEWRILTGAGGARHYVDSALLRVYLGPRVSEDQARRICALLKDRPTEVLQGKVVGYELQFETIKAATPLGDCERVAECSLDLSEIILDQAELEAFFKVPFSRLVNELKAIAARPNTLAIEGCDISGNHNKNAVYVWSKHLLRSGREVWCRRYFDRHMRLLPG